jgi:bifunctional non-homologous end joining protein LigD
MLRRVAWEYGHWLCVKVIGPLAMSPGLFLARLPVITLRHLVPPLPCHKCNGIRRRRVPALMKKSPARSGKPAGHISVAVEAAPRGALPEFIPPELATLVSRPPQGDQWLHEIKFDGYRTAARLAGGRVSMLTRPGLDWTPKFAPIARDLASLKARAAYIDGEVVVLDQSGVSRFGGLQQALSEGRAERMLYFTFDLLHLDGRDLRGLPSSSGRKR